MEKKEGDTMKKYLISEEGQFYKAYLHCHTTLSGGVMIPQEAKAGKLVAMVGMTVDLAVAVEEASK